MDTNLSGLGQQSAQPEKLQELLQFFKVGRCVNGVAHDVNNCLGAILAYAELTSLDPHLEAEPRRMVGKILDAVERASALVTELTNVARPTKPASGVIEFRHMIKGILLLRDYDLRIAQVVVTCDMDESLPSLLGDVARMRLALLYLLMNAEEAARQSLEKTVDIGVHAREDCLELTIRNSGAPIEDAIRQQMFEPFYTTKDGFHLGLGLGATLEIIAAHEGSLEYDPLRGFVVLLPFHTPAHPETAHA